MKSFDQIPPKPSQTVQTITDLNKLNLVNSVLPEGCDEISSIY